MSDFIQRLYEEKNQLEEKVVKLTAFLSSENFQKVEINQRLLLKSQLYAMNSYLEILNHRLFLLSPAESVG